MIRHLAPASLAAHRRGPEFGRWRRQRDHAARARQHGTSARRFRRSMRTTPLLWQYTPAAAGRLPVAAGFLQDETEPRDRRQQVESPQQSTCGILRWTSRPSGRVLGMSSPMITRVPTTAARWVVDKVLVGAGNCSPGHANSATGTYAGMFPPGGCFCETRKATVAIRRHRPGGRAWAFWNNLRTRSAAVAPSGWSGSTTRS